MSIFVNGGNGRAEDGSNPELRARELARRYRREFVDLKNYHIQHELFKAVPVDLMFRYNFVPLEEQGEELTIAIDDPSRLMMIDEIGLLLNKRVKTKVATRSQIEDILKKTEQSQRVLDEATEGFTFDVVREDEPREELGLRFRTNQDAPRHHHQQKRQAAEQQAGVE